MQDAYAPDGIVLSKSEIESDSELPPLTSRHHRNLASRGRRRHPSRESKKGINYKGTFVLFCKQSSVSE